MVQAWKKKAIDRVAEKPANFDLGTGMSALFNNDDVVRRDDGLREAVVTRRQDDISNALGVPMPITPFNNQEMRQLKRMLFNPLYLKTRATKKLVRDVVAM